MSLLEEEGRNIDLSKNKREGKLVLAAKFLTRRTVQELGTGPRVRRMFSVDNFCLPLVAHISVAAATTISSNPSLALWHARLGHASSSQVQQLVSRGLLSSVSTKNFDCVSCQLGKQSALLFNTSESISTKIFNLIHSDV